MSKLITVITITVVLKLEVNEVGFPLSVVSWYVMPYCVKVKVPAGSSVPVAYRSHTLLSIGKISSGLNAVSVHIPLTLRYVALSVSLDSLRLFDTTPEVVAISCTYCSLRSILTTTL